VPLHIWLMLLAEVKGGGICQVVVMLYGCSALLTKALRPAAVVAHARTPE